MYGYIKSPTPDEIYHHGILGQKWGKKQGPPYPLDAGNHSAAERKAGWKKSLDSGDKKKNTPSSNESKEFGFHTLVKDSEANKNQITVRDQENKELNNLKKPNIWTKKNTKKYSDEYERISSKYDKKYDAAYKKDKDNEQKAWSSLKENEQIKKEWLEAQKLSDKQDRLYEQYLGVNSKAYKEAYEKYKRDNKDLDDEELAYGFDHYYWGGSESGPEYKRAYEAYKNDAKTITQQYNEKIENIVNHAVGDSKISSFTSQEIKYGKWLVENKIREERRNH